MTKERPSTIPRTRRNRECDDPRKVGQWKIGRTIGSGTSGRVRIARHTATSQLAAVKIVSKQAFAPATGDLQQTADEAEQALRALEREIVIMKLIDHPNIMRLYDVYETSSQVYLILEYIQGGELFEYINEKGKLPISEAMNYFQQIMSAVDYCHRFNIAHRDLKPENILLDEQKNIKIADFGMAAWLGNGMLLTSCGSPHYAAPEIICGEVYDGSTADVWSCGIILFTMLAGQLPFDDDDLPALLQKIVKGQFQLPAFLPTEAQDLIVKMLQKNPANRIRTSDIFRHPFFQSAPSKAFFKAVPSLEGSTDPVQHIDEHLFSNILTLWHGIQEDDLRESLYTQEPTCQKAVYLLLVDHRMKQEEQDREVERLQGLKSSHMLTGDYKESSPPLSNPSQNLRSEVTTLPHTSSFSSEGTCSASMIDKPVSATTTLPLQPLTVPTHLKDERLQVFLQQIVDQLNTVRSPIPHSDSSSQSATVVQSTIEDILANMGPETIDVQRRGTRPLNIPHKPMNDRRCQKEDKENVGSSIDESYIFVNKAGNSQKSPGQKVQMMDAPSPGSKTHARNPSKLRKKIFGEAPMSPNLSEGTAYSFSSSRRNWLENVGSVFKSPRPSVFSLLSTHEAQTTRNECRRLLMAMNIRVALENAEGLGTLKCRLDTGLQDPVGSLIPFKQVRFRAEVELFPMDAQESDYRLIVTLIHEKGSAESFREVWKRLRRDWRFDIIGSQTPIDLQPSPVLNLGPKFFESSF